MGQRILTGLGGMMLALIAASAAPGAEKTSPYKSPLGVAVDHAGHRAYVALHTAHEVAEIDLTTGAVLKLVSLGTAPDDVALATKQLWVFCDGTTEVLHVDLARGGVTERLPAARAPVSRRYRPAPVIPLLEKGSNGMR